MVIVLSLLALFGCTSNEDGTDALISTDALDSDPEIVSPTDTDADAAPPDDLLWSVSGQLTLLDGDLDWENSGLVFELSTPEPCSSELEITTLFANEVTSPALHSWNLSLAEVASDSGDADCLAQAPSQLTLTIATPQVLNSPSAIASGLNPDNLYALEVALPGEEGRVIGYLATQTQRDEQEQIRLEAPIESGQYLITPTFGYLASSL